MLQGQRDLATVGRMLLSELAPLVEAQNGVIYLVDAEAKPATVAAITAFLPTVVFQNLKDTRSEPPATDGLIFIISE